MMAFDKPEFAAQHGYLRSHRGRFEYDLAQVREINVAGPVLEVGAFPFFFTVLLTQAGVPVTAVDIAPERFPAIIDAYQLRVEAIDIELERLPFDDASFDLVILTEVLEHLRIDPMFALSEISRVLRPGGALYLTTPNLYRIKNVLRFLVGRGLGDVATEFHKLRAIGHMGHLREYCARDVRGFLHSQNFRIERAHYWQSAQMGGIVGALARSIFAVAPLLRNEQVVIARKAGPSTKLEPLFGSAP
jgi:SAM-dependent methyltransferase